MLLTIGQQVGSYRIEQEIAHGQYAIIYKATHSILTSRIVALKFLYTTRITSTQEFEQFFQEARVLEQLQHPHILPVMDTNVHEHYPYTITEFATHGSLRDRLHKLKGQPLAQPEALEILRQIGEGLQFAHDHKIVHSDIKPENILFNASNTVRISDFDIARTLRRANTQTASAGGTPAYMAPEQFQGKVRKESDQYALGCIAYELLTGQRAFKGNDLAALTQAHLHSEPQPLRQLNAGLSEGLEQAVQRALSKKYTERYESVAEFIQALATAPVGKQQQTVRATTVRKGEHLILPGEKHTKVAGEEIYYEKTLVEEATPREDDPFTAATIVDENAPVKRKTTRKVTTESKKTVAAKAVKTKIPAEKAVPEEQPGKVRKTSSSRAKTTTAKKPMQREEQPAAPVHKTAAILAREAILPKPVAPAEKVVKASGEKKAGKAHKPEEVTVKEGVVVKKKRVAAKTEN